MEIKCSRIDAKQSRTLLSFKVEGKCYHVENYALLLAYFEKFSAEKYTKARNFSSSNQ